MRLKNTTTDRGRQAYLNAKAGKGLSPAFETTDQGKRWMADQRRRVCLNQKHAKSNQRSQ